MGSLLAVLLSVTPPVPGPAEYRALLEDYRAGRYETAVDGLAAVPEEVVRDEIERVSRLPRCAGCPGAEARRAVPFAAAVLAHTERAFLDLEAEHRTGAEVHLALARGWLELGRPATLGMAARWHLACALDALWWTDAERTEREVKDGLRWDAREPRLWLASGAAAELRARQDREEGHVRDALRTAEERHRRALALDPRLTEARLRRGRVLAELGRAKEAAAELDAALAAGGDPRVAYLAGLFRGRIEEKAGSWSSAARHYRAATAAWPSAESGWLALAHALDRAGDAPGAAAAVARALDLSAPDPYRGFLFGPQGALAAVLQELRAEAR